MLPASLAKNLTYRFSETEGCHTLHVPRDGPNGLRGTEEMTDTYMEKWGSGGLWALRWRSWSTLELGVFIICSCTGARVLHTAEEGGGLLHTSEQGGRLG